MSSPIKYKKRYLSMIFGYSVMEFWDIFTEGFSLEKTKLHLG